MPKAQPDELIVAQPAGRYGGRPPMVVDCSALAAVLFDEPQRERAAAALSGRELFAPDLIDYELVELAMAKSRGGMDEIVQQGLADLTRLQLTRCRVDPAGQLKLAVEHGLTANDAAYLWLAEVLVAPLVTFDRRLGEAARKYLEGG